MLQPTTAINGPKYFLPMPIAYLKKSEFYQKQQVINLKKKFFRKEDLDLQWNLLLLLGGESQK